MKRLLFLSCFLFNILSFAAYGKGECLVDELVCDAGELSQAQAWGLPSYVQLASLLQPEGSHVHRSKVEGKQVLAVRGQPQPLYPQGVLKLVAALKQAGFTEEDSFDGVRVFTTQGDEQMVILGHHQKSDRLEVSLAFWQDS